MNDLFNQIQKDYLMAVLHIPNSMPKLFNKSLLNKLKENEGDVGDQEEIKELIGGENIIEIISSSSENESDKTKIINKIKNKFENKKIAVDLFNGKKQSIY